MLFIKFLSAIAFICSIIWLFVSPGFEPALAIITSLSAFIASWLTEEGKPKQQLTQQQSVSKFGIGIQAGGDVRIDSVQTGREVEKNAK